MSSGDDSDVPIATRKRLATKRKSSNAEEIKKERKARGAGNGRNADGDVEMKSSEKEMRDASKKKHPKKRAISGSDDDVDDVPRKASRNGAVSKESASRKTKKALKDVHVKDKAVIKFETSPTASPSKISVTTLMKRDSSAMSAKEEEDNEKATEEEEYKWWLEQDRDNTVKWTTLHHNGVYFPPPYIPHGVKMLYDGKEVDLEPEAEEVASFFAALLETDYVQNPTFCKNFFKDFRQVLSECQKKSPIKEFDKCDFTPIFRYLEEVKANKKAMTKQEKESIKKEKAELDEKYGIAFLDGRKEKVGNYRIEPPGLFRGRGEHPKTGSLKRRVMPEQVTLNLSEDAPVPPAPAGHTWKSIIHDNTVTWLATWKENVNGNVKYVFLAANSSLKGQSDLKKFEKARELKKYITDIRKTYMAELSDKVMEIRQRATALYLIDRLALRAGNEKGEDEADTVGCCSLRLEHVRLHPPNTVEFDFLGKDSIRYLNEVEVEPQAFKNLGIFMRPPKEPSDMIFDRLTPSSLNKHLNQLMPGLTAKVFRTYNASITMQEQLGKLTAEAMPAAEKVLAYNRANREVAVLCNHQRTVPKSHSTQMGKLKDKILALKYQRRAIKRQLRELFKATNESKKESVDTDESELDEDWCVQHEIDVVAAEREKAQKKYDHARERLLAEGHDPETHDDGKAALTAFQAHQKKTDELEEAFLQHRKSGHMLEVVKSPTVEKCEKAITRLTERIQTLRTQAVDREENKTTALGTSKINYIDPRITAAWCTRHNVPLDKMFSKTLREKFKWAMDVDADWIF